jgi:DNA-binding PucR family transcriptional regulator
MSWELPSPQVRELIRRGAQIAVNPPAEWLEELDRATLSAAGRQKISEDPVLAAASRRATRSNLLVWAAANLRDPGRRVSANLDDAVLAGARDLVRRGLNESSLDAYRVGQGVALRLWTQLAFTLTSEPEELRQLLDVSCRSISAFVDDTVAAVSAEMSREREALTRGTLAERREVVSLLLDGAPIPRQRAERQLGYRLAGPHTAAIIWSEDPDADLSALDRATEQVSAAADAGQRPLTVLATATTRWLWMHSRPDVTQLRAGIALPGVRVALGSTGLGVDGFRRSHLDALTVQRMLARLSSPQRVATHEEVELVALLTSDPERADHFVKRTLGDLETAGNDITDSVRVFIAAGCNASHAAGRVPAHRNTLLRRLARADELLPRPLAENIVNVGAALEMLRWRGMRVSPKTG